MNLTSQQRAMVAVLLAGTLLAVLNQTLLTPALPTIMSHLSVSATTAQWLTSGYSLVEAVIIPLNAYLLGRVSTRKLYIGGMCLFAAGSAVCAAAPGFGWLMAGRVMQAMATGVALPTVFTLILLIFPRERRGSAMGLIGLILSFAPAVGPSVSGALVDTVGWRALFVLVVVLAVGVVVAAALALRNFEGFERTAFDALSVALSAVGLACLLYGLSTFSSGPAAAAGFIAAGVAVVALFVRRQLRLDSPLLAVGVLRHRRFAVAVLLVTLLEAVLIGSGVILPIFVQNGLGASATVSGLLMLPGALVGALCGLLAGRLFDRFGIRRVALVGVAVLAVGVVGYFSFAAGESLALVCLFYTVACIGLQSLVTPVNAWGVNALPNAKVPHGNAIVSTMEQVGGSFGTAFTVSLSALAGPLGLAGADTQGAGAAIAGCHLSFAGLLGLVAVVAVVVAALVRDRGPAAAPAAAAGVPGVDRAWRVADVMNAAPDVLEGGATVRDAIELMRRTETSGVPIADGGRVVGFLSDGDILKAVSQHRYSKADADGYRVLLESDGIRERLAEVLDEPALSLATRDVVCVGAADDAEAAFRTLAARRIKKVPVVDGGCLVGTLSRRNIMFALQAMEGPIADEH